ncbi:MAG: RluA family pseudouridine synthase [Parachlamydiaceae bacterium]|nr:RluA family pseudouridine synthase [Parachlamydiaceae bacterium]
MKTEEDFDLITVNEQNVGERLDKVLSNHFSETYSRTYFQYLIDQNLVLLNGVPAKKRHKVCLNDEIEVQFVATPEAQVKPEAIPLSILFEDEYLLAINKPIGMVVHPAPGHWNGTFVNALLNHCGILPESENLLRPGIVHRLDKDTSGVLIAAKTLEVQQKLTVLFADRQIYKEYIAICVGKGKDEEINEPIGRHPIHRKQMAVVENGKPAISYFQTIGWDEKLSVVKATIATGRTHQIRVHLKHRGTPVLGDSLYGIQSMNHKYGVDHQLLHASILRFKHPITGKLIELVAEPSEILSHYLKKIL